MLKLTDGEYGRQGLHVRCWDKFPWLYISTLFCVLRWLLGDSQIMTSGFEKWWRLWCTFEFVKVKWRSGLLDSCWVGAKNTFNWWARDSNILPYLRTFVMQVLLLWCSQFSSTVNGEDLERGQTSKTYSISYRDFYVKLHELSSTVVMMKFWEWWTAVLCYLPLRDTVMGVFWNFN